MKNKALYLLVAAITIAAIVFVVYSFSRPHEYVATNQMEDSTSSSAVVDVSKKYHFTLTCMDGLVGKSQGDTYFCDSPNEEYFLGGIMNVTSTTFQSVKDVVNANNQKLALTDSAYMQIVRETTVDSEPAIIVKQTFGSEAGPSSDTLAKTLLVIHNGYLYSLYVPELQKNVDEFFASLHFTE